MPRCTARLATAGLLLAALAGHARADDAGAAFRRLGNEFLAHWLSQRPQTATRLGLHTYAGVLLPLTPAWVASEAEWLRGLRSRLGAIPREALDFDRALERDVLAARIDRELLDLEVIRPWERNPNVYLDLVAGSVQSLLQRDFASSCSRVRSATRRLRMVPEVLRAAKLNLKHPPRLYTEVAISQAAGVLQFYRQAIPALTAGCRDPLAQADLAEADTGAVAAVQDFLTFLREDLLPRSDGDFALGRETYQRKLIADEMEGTPTDSLLARAYRALDEARNRMEALATRIAPGQGVAAALDSIQSDAPSETGLVPAVQEELEGVRAFVRSHGLVTMPSKENLVVRETPPFRRSLSFASMDAPGVWEPRAGRAFYNVTPVEPTWTPKQKRDHLAFFNRYASQIVTIHEALPGHYYQFLASRGMKSRLRQALTCGTAVEGWAHYCEQLAIEQGFGQGDPRYELAQQFLAIQRIGRMIVGLSLHTAGMTVEQAERLFEERCYMAPVNAQREARRGALDPTYLVYTLGKWRILELRDEVRAQLGDRFRIRAFNDALLHQGGSPMPVVRAGVLRELLGRDDGKAAVR